MKNLPANLPSEAEQRKLGQQMKDLQRSSTEGLMSCIALGDLVTQVRETIVSARGNVAAGPAAKGDGVKGWLETYTDSEVTLSSAYRYEQIAENIREELGIGKRIDLAYTITSAPDDAAKKLREKIQAFVAGKSQRTLLLSIGKPDGARGGARPRGKKATPEELRDAYLQDAKNRSISVFDGLHGLDDRWQVLDDAVLEIAVKDAEQFAKRARKWLELPKGRRPEFNVEKYQENKA
jgi:hypothetical protein